MDLLQVMLFFLWHLSSREGVYGFLSELVRSQEGFLLDHL